MSDPGRHEFDTLGSKTVYTGAIIALRVDTVAMPGGQRADREVVEHHGAVAVVALDEHDNLVLIRQYRHPLGHRLWEIPAGLLDAAGRARSRQQRVSWAKKPDSAPIDGRCWSM
ncbi:hypothetical protein GCM10020255_084040 [Rhodococcus baikonurensis]